jgi:hypothetical protein
MPTAEEFLTTVIRPTLIQIGLHSRAAEQLLLGTAMQESDFIHRRQMGGGPACSFFRMEPATHNDIWQNFLELRRRASFSCSTLSFRGRPNRPPCCWAAIRPAVVRS